ncbi:MAG: hypothetical protein IT308_09720 [Anaerolineaceae bacterium]|nr:hypothetical protein [Anaerolineaceae bacterium]
MRRNLLMIAPLLFLSVLALTAGLWAGLLRLGWVLPSLSRSLPISHGELMISGFLGTLVTLERVAALRKRWMLSAPVLTSLGWILGLALPGLMLGPVLITLGSLGAVAILLIIARRETQVFTVVMALGTISWLVGNVLWLSGTPVPRVVGLWGAYLILTIVGERLELSRVLRPTRKRYAAFTIAVLLYLAGVLMQAFGWLPKIGVAVGGVGMLALTAWLLLFDIARYNLRHRIPLTRYIALCLFLGYLWLGVSGIFNLAFGMQVAGFRYDAMLHALFLGFVFSMIVGHAPIILPALTGIQFPYHPRLLLPLTLLHASLILRIAADLSSWHTGRMWGGLLNEVALTIFFALAMRQVVLSRRSKPA